MSLAAVNPLVGPTKGAGPGLDGPDKGICRSGLRLPGTAADRTGGADARQKAVRGRDFALFHDAYAFSGIFLQRIFRQSQGGVKDKQKSG
jgi:hypothetical protein